MSESPTSTQTPTDELFEQQMRAIERGQRMLTRSAMVPFRQAVEIQWNLGEMFLRGLELNESLGRMGADVTRSAFRSYMNSFEDVAADVTRQAGREGQGMPGTQPAPVPQQPQRGSEPLYGQRGMPPQQTPPQQAPPQPTPPQRAPPQRAPPRQTPSQQPPPQQAPAEPEAPPSEPPSEQQRPETPPETEDQSPSS